MEPNPGNPKAPTVKVLINQTGGKLPDPYLVKSDEPDTQIVRPLTREESVRIDPKAMANQE
ncbi:MAG: hypothetical protein LBT33_03555 [Spirochaetia bacterium]|nr:hypothetical protein [Spirochaetia bacterium]